MTHEQFKKKLAKMLADIDAPCKFSVLIDGCADICEAEEIDDEYCDYYECWLRVLEQIEKEG